MLHCPLLRLSQIEGTSSNRPVGRPSLRSFFWCQYSSRPCSPLPLPSASASCVRRNTQTMGHRSYWSGSPVAELERKPLHRSSRTKTLLASTISSCIFKAPEPSCRGHRRPARNLGRNICRSRHSRLPHRLPHRDAGGLQLRPHLLWGPRYRARHRHRCARRGPQISHRLAISLKGRSGMLFCQ